MTFDEILTQVVALLRREGRVSYRALKRRLELDDAYLEDLKEELIYAKKLAVDEDGRVLIWMGDTEAASRPGSEPAPTAVRTGEQGRTPRSYTPRHLAEKILTSKTALEGERKQVTVLFADLKGSMELLADRDPEEARQLLDPVLERMMAAVHRYEGTVNQVMGDGIMALFGAPIAHEDHAVRACYAALAMQEAIRTYAEEARRTHGITVQMRVGLNSGGVVVRAIGNDLHMDYSAIGQTTHLAARMEQLATPGSILLTAETLQLAEGFIQVKPLGPVPVKGLVAPVEVFELVGATTIRRRFQAAVARGLTRFVGRETELAALQYALERAGAEHGQVVAVLGEAGMGKSRLVYEFVHSYRLQGWLVLESASVSYGRATPYVPVIDLLKRYAHVQERDDVRTVRAKVTGQVLTLDDALQETIPALLALLEALPEDNPFQQLDPPQRRQRTLDALKRVLVRETQAQPLVLVFEDLHWIDAETQALLDSLVESLPTARLLLLVNYRPEYRHNWGSKTYYTQLRLDPLPPVNAEELLEALLGHEDSLAVLKQLLITRTEGNPFFLEESVRTLVETGALVGKPGAYQLAQSLPTIHVPVTVQAVLAARIDRLPAEEKRLLQTAAVIGHEVLWRLLQAVAELPEDALYRGLTHLQSAEFLYETRLFPELEYTFKHALTHEVAYGSVLQESRRILHARIVEALEETAGDRLVEQVERLAHHALRGEVWDKAVAYSRRAGEKAMARSAYREAVGCYEQALAALDHLPEQRATREQAVDLRLALRSALRPLGDFGRILAYLREAESLAKALGDSRRLGQISQFLSNYFYIMGAHDQAITAGQRALALATADGEVVLQALANQYLGLAYHAQGDYRRAIDCLGQTVTSLDRARHRERFGEAFLPAVFSRAALTDYHAELGLFAEGRALGEEGLQMAEAVAHPASLMWASWGLGRLSLCQGDLHRALPLLERAVGICQDADLPAWFPRMAAALGAAYTLGRRVADAVPLLTQALQQSTATERAHFEMLCRLSLGETQLLAGHLEESHVLAERALVLARAHQERGHEAYVLRLLGDIATHCEPPDTDQAEAHYSQALALAEELGMRPLVAHCHLGLGMLYAKMGQRNQACAALIATIDLYRAMAMTFWLPEAEAALAQVEKP
jgi:class 3 adenylate cyclase/tetratricopeptide (TPR) repeat protein